MINNGKKSGDVWSCMKYEVKGRQYGKSEVLNWQKN
mgnify:CR=1 FL=1